MAAAADAINAQAPYNPITSRQGGNVADAAKGALDKDAFMKLLVAQLANQDPMSPSDPSEFVAQLSQFSSLEQLVNLKEGMDLLAITETAGTSAQMVSFIGKSVQFGDAPVPWEPGNEPITTSFKLGSSADDVTVTIRGANGEELEKRKLGPMTGGEHAFVFDGLRADGTRYPKGTYQIEVTAADAEGVNVDLKQWSRGEVTGVTFAAGYPQLMLADGRTIGLSEVFEVGAMPSDTNNNTNDTTEPQP